MYCVTYLLDISAYALECHWQSCSEEFSSEEELKAWVKFAEQNSDYKEIKSWISV